MARWLAVSVLALWLWPWLLPGAPALAAPTCQLVLGFATLAADLPQQIGTCLDDEQHNPANGDALQHTTGGLLVWRKADNWTAFTDGYQTWINGPMGLAYRLNSQRFVWEAPSDGVACPPGGQTCAVPASDPAGPLDLVHHLVPSAGASYRWGLGPTTITPALDARLQAPNQPPGAATGPPSPYALFVQSEGGVPDDLFYAAQATAAGTVVTVTSGTYRGLNVLSFAPRASGLAYLVVVQAGNWRVADVQCPGQPAESLLAGSVDWLGCSLFPPA